MIYLKHKFSEVEKMVFISYSTADANEAYLIKSVLEKNGVDTWMAPESIPAGSNYTKEIPKAISECSVFLLVLSDSAQKSVWVSAEVERAFKCSKIIMPFVIENCALQDDFDFLLSRSQRITAYEKKADALENLVIRIKSLIQVSGTEDVGAAYAATYPIALISVVLSSQNLIMKF